MTNLVHSPAGLPTRSTPRQRCKHFVAASVHYKTHSHNQAKDAKQPVPSELNRRQALLGVLAGTAAMGWTVAPSKVLAKTKEEMPTIINDPVELKAQLEAQYGKWSAGQVGAWLAGQPENIKWQSTYNSSGKPLKFKGKAGVQQYFAMLKADLDIQSYKPLAIFVDNDGDEATVVVEISGTSKLTQQPFGTIVLHKYGIGPMGQVLKFKEVTDTALLAQLVPPPSSQQEPVSAATDVVTEATEMVQPSPVEGEAPVQPGSGAWKV